MITQKPISLKIDAHLLEELDKEISLGYMKRNAAINQAIRAYLILKDYRRRIRSYGNVEDKMNELRDLINVLVPESFGIELQIKYILSEKPEK